MNYTSINNNYTSLFDSCNDYNDNFNFDIVNGNVNGNVNCNVNNNDYVNDIVNINYNKNDNDNKNDNKNDNEINADKLLNDYNSINTSLKLNINTINQLENEKKEIFNYKSTIFSKHQDIMIKLYKKDFGEMNEINELNDCIIKYIDLLKNYTDKWNTDYYNKKKKYLETNITKQEDKLSSYRKLFINTTTEIIKTEKINKNLCPICFENEINMCAIPCGHTCCNDCIIQSIKYHNSRVTKCLNCRNPINEYIKFYIQL
jgi:hypothetical protein